MDPKKHGANRTRVLSFNFILLISQLKKTQSLHHIHRGKHIHKHRRIHTTTQACTRTLTHA